MPALKAAEKALEAIDKKDITELKTIKQFNKDVDMVLSTVCILMGVKPDRCTGGCSFGHRSCSDEQQKRDRGVMFSKHVFQCARDWFGPGKTRA